MTLKTLFLKPIDRPIEGVIKADDEASLRLELEEYVLTNEVEKRLEGFLDAYTNYQGANGVWISGFFGSGKSHLLKILAMLLEDREIDGVRASDLFLPKCEHNEILRGDLKRAVNIPSKSILFNIDQKADVISKTQIDALMAVFVKVFDEMCGYYGKQGYIAQFERDMEERDLYQKFKSVYEEVSGKTWEKGRERALLEAGNIATAYAKTSGADEIHSLGILDKYRNEYRVSIEDFAENVAAYLDRQHKDFRLNFYVDEVGQYIDKNVKLMTNLQTIAESLATRCKGRAWVIVTAQEDMSSVVGEMTVQQGNDFSKIQARFSNRLKLTSADVAEVIQKRLLLKNEEGVSLLSDLYHQQANNLKTLFDFADGAQSYRNFQDRDHFIHCYPFIPYQFSLFQSAIQSLSQHDAFEGKHSSVGERSMLGVFQQVAMQIGDHKPGQLATFDLMFEGIRTALKSHIQYSVVQAERHLDNQFAIRLLKALLLVKYVKEFKPSLRNLCVLMLESFDQDIAILRKQVEEAVNLLEQQTYVQRNGALYEYLTDEEKDVEKEIKNTEVENTEVAAELEKLIFDHILKQRKIRYDTGGSGSIGQDYTFSRKLDDRLHGREYELAINIISPLHEHTANEQMLRTSSTYKIDELFVVLPANDRLLHDLLMYKKTEKYIRQNMTMSQQETVKRILSDKGARNQERFADLRHAVQVQLGKANLWVGGADVDAASEDPQTRIIKGFYELIARAYPNLRMLRGINYTEEMIRTVLNGSAGSLFSTDSTVLSEAEQEVLAYVQSNRTQGVRTTIKSVTEKFERKPYGWYFAAILCTLASLCARGKLELRVDSQLLEEEAELDRALRNTHGHGSVILDPQVEFSASQVRLLKTFLEDFFDSPPSANEAKALGQEAAASFQSLTQKLTALQSQSTSYQFLQALNPVLTSLNDCGKKPYAWFLTQLSQQQDALLEMKENIIDPLCKFMNGTQVVIYDDARQFMQTQQANIGYISGEEAKGVNETLLDPNCFRGNRMQQMKVQLDSLNERVSEQVKVELKQAEAAIAALKVRLSGIPEFKSLNTEQQDQLTQAFEALQSTVKSQVLIPVIRDSLRRFEETEYPRLLEKMGAWVHQVTFIDNPAAGGTSSQPGAAPSLPNTAIHYVALRTIAVGFNKAWLANETDVDAYLKEMRQVLLEEIKQGKRIQI